MLSFDDEFATALPAPPSPETILRLSVGSSSRRHLSRLQLSREPVHDLDVEAQAMQTTASAACALEDKRVINAPVRRQPARPVQVQVGLGQVPRRLRQPLDAAGDQHAARHRAVEEPERADRRRAADRQAQPRLLRHRRYRSPPTTSCSAPIATSPRPSAGSTCCARRSRKRSTRTPTSTSSRAWASNEAEIFNAYHEIKSIRDKDEFLIPFIDVLTDPDVQDRHAWRPTRSS